MQPYQTPQVAQGFPPNGVQWAGSVAPQWEEQRYGQPEAMSGPRYGAEAMTRPRRMPLGESQTPPPMPNGKRVQGEQSETRPLIEQPPIVPNGNSKVAGSKAPCLDEKASDGEDVSDSEDSESCCDPCRIGLGICALLMALVLLSGAGFIFYVTTNAGTAWQTMATESFGTPVQVDAVDVGIVQAKTTVHGVTVANPPGYEGNFLQLRYGTLDTSIWSMMQKIVELEEMALEDFNVTMVQRLDENLTDGKVADPNFVPILDHLENSSSSGMEPPSFLGGKISTRKWIVDRLEMRNINFVVDMRLQMALGNMDILDPADKLKLGRFSIPLVQVRSIGRWTGGVSMDQLMTIVTHALISSAIQALPANIKRSMLEGIRGGVHDIKRLDFDSMSADLGLGEGLKEITKLVDKVTNKVNKNGRRKYPALHKASKSFESAMDAAGTVGDEMADVMLNTTDAWGDAITDDDAEALDRAVNITGAVFDTALTEAAVKARSQGGVGEDVADALNATQQMSRAIESTADKVDASTQAALSAPTTPSPLDEPVATATVITLTTFEPPSTTGWTTTAASSIF